MISAAIGVLGAGLLGVIGWAIQLNSRVSVVEADSPSLERLINSKFEDVERRLERIERKLDAERG